MSSTFLILFLIQVLISVFFRKYVFDKDKTIFTGTFILYLIYGVASFEMDVRVLMSGITPFYIFLNNKFFVIKNFTILIIILLLISILNLFI